MKCFPWWLLVCVPLLWGCAGLGIGPDTRDFEGRVTVSTPFDEKYERVRRHLEQAAKLEYQREHLGDYWRLPYETERQGGGDCEDMAIWLYAKLLADGFEDVRFVAGLVYDSMARTHRYGHAWVQWHSTRGVYVLDATDRSGWPWPAHDTKRWMYLATFSYYRSTRYAHRWTP